jgi:hypothetical protein
VAENEKHQYDRQQAKIWRDREGMVHLKAVFAPEDGAFIKNTLDLLLGPRIGGPRVASKRAIAEAEALRDDPRNVEQLTAGAIVALVKAAVEVEHSEALAKKRPAVQIVVTATELTRPDGDGIAFIEGTGIAVTMNTVNRLVCDTGYRPVVLAASTTTYCCTRTDGEFTALVQTKTDTRTDTGSPRPVPAILDNSLDDCNSRGLFVAIRVSPPKQAGGDTQEALPQGFTRPTHG